MLSMVRATMDKIMEFYKFVQQNLEISPPGIFLGRRAVDKTHVAAMMFMNCATASGIFGHARKNTHWTKLVEFNDLSWTVRPKIAFLGKLEKTQIWQICKILMICPLEVLFPKNWENSSASRKQHRCTYPSFVWGIIRRPPFSRCHQTPKIRG